MLFHHDNASVHTSAIAMTRIEVRISTATTDLLGFSTLREISIYSQTCEEMARRKEIFNSEVIDAVNGYFEELDKSFYKNSIMVFEYR